MMQSSKPPRSGGALPKHLALRSQPSLKAARGLAEGKMRRPDQVSSLDKDDFKDFEGMNFG